MAKTEMTKNDMNEFKKLIDKKRTKLLEELDYLQQSSLRVSPKESTGDNSSYSLHMADQAFGASEQEKNLVFSSREERYLHHLNEALDRIDRGIYGKCFVCKKHIKKARLKAVPHARLCIECKTKEENGEIVFDSHQEYDEGK